MSNNQFPPDDGSPLSSSGLKAGASRGHSVMAGWVLTRPGPLGSAQLDFQWHRDLPVPMPNSKEVLLKVRTCGVCHTDLHTLEGDLQAPPGPLIPGHQVVATVESISADNAWVPIPPGLEAGWAERLIANSGGGTAKGLWLRPGRRVGVPWLFGTCGTCQYCRSGDENLCEHPHFTGLSRNGGYAEYLVALAPFLVPIPERFNDDEAAPLLCAGIIGYRSLRLAGIGPGVAANLGLYGFGASAHLTMQLALAWGHAVYVFTRSQEHRRLALLLGARWAGAPEEMSPELLDAAITFAPVGAVIPLALRSLAKGGTLAVNAVHLDGVPAFGYDLLYGERSIRSVANATRKDAWEWMYWADISGTKPIVQQYDAKNLPMALTRLKHGDIRGSAVVRIASSSPDPSPKGLQ